MHRGTVLLSLLLLAGARGVSAQEAQPPAHAYEAYYKISYGDLEEWNRLFNRYAVPVLTALQNEGVLEGWAHWQHHTGGDYNVRMTVRTFDWTAMDTFWDEYFSRLNESVPAADFDAWLRMTRAHRDEIWDVASVTVPDGLEAGYMYAAKYQINFADVTEWNGLWRDVAAPALAKLMEEGILGGWVQLTHNTGGSRNSKILYLFEEWDHMDDFFARFQQTVAAEHPAEFQRWGELILAHDDIIWVPAPQPGG